MKTTLFFLLILIFGNSGQSQSVDSITNFDKYSSSDTLEIVSYLSSCGEFGGHKEVFKLFKSDKPMMIYHREPRHCFPEPPPLPSNIVINYAGPITIDKQKLITNYLKQLQGHKPVEGHGTNAPNFYWVILNSREIFRIFDRDASWKDYEKFRDTLLKE